MRLLVLCLLAIPAAASAQSVPGVRFGLLGGVSYPCSNTADAFRTGWHGGALVELRIPVVPIALRAEGIYQRMSYKPLPGFSGDVRVLAGVGSVVVRVPSPVVHPYVLGGAGYYDVRFGREAGGVSESETERRFGWSAGCGVALSAGRMDLRLEARYHRVSTSHNAFTFVPVSLALVF